MTHTPKLILVVLESADDVLVEKWMNEGALPHLRKLKENGVWSKISSQAYISSGCVWPSLTVGVNPGKHGYVFFHRQLKSGTYRIVKRYSEDMPLDYFWIPLSKAGKKVAIMDVPLSRPEKEINGYFYCNWGDEHPGWKPDSLPKSLLPEIINKFGQHPLHDWYQHNPSDINGWQDFKKRLHQGVKTRTKVSNLVLSKGEFDFAFINYSEPHWAGHMAWHIHDSKHPQHEPQVREACGNILLHNYQDLDKAVGELADKYSESNFIIMSHIGMTTQTGGELITTEVLNKLGLSGKNSDQGFLSKVKNKIFPGSEGVSQGVQNVEKVISPKVMTFVKRFIPERFWDDWTRRYLSLGTGWKNSKAFLVPGDHASLIRINLKGRDPNGTITPGKEYQDLIEEIAAAFKELKVVDSGEKAVTRIEFLQETIWGDEAHEFPDLAIIWRYGLPIEAVESERLGRIELKEFNKRSGGHSDGGFVIYSGPDIKRGVELDLGDSLDIVPTIFSLLDVEPPDYIDGKTIYDKITLENHG